MKDKSLKQVSFFAYVNMCILDIETENFWTLRQIGYFFLIYHAQFASIFCFNSFSANDNIKIFAF